MKVVRNLANQQMLGHGDWQVTLAAVQHAAPSVKFEDDGQSDLFTEISEPLRACRLAYFLLDHLQFDAVPDEQAWVRLRAMADDWLREWVVAMGQGDGNAPNHPDGRDDNYIFYPATRPS